MGLRGSEQSEQTNSLSRLLSNPSVALWSLEGMGKQMKKQQMLCRMRRA